MHDALSDVLFLARYERTGWEARRAEIPAWHPRNDGPDDPPEDPPGEPQFRTVEEYEGRQSAIRDDLTALDQEYVGRPMPVAQTSRWNSLNEELERNAKLIVELRQRQERLAQLADNPAAGEHPEARARARRGSSDIWDVWAVRQQASGPEDEVRMLRDNARRAIEKASFPHPDISNDQAREHIESLIERFQTLDDHSNMGAQEGNSAAFARRLLLTGSPVYQRAFGKQVMGRALTPEEQRALSTANSGGGFAVPFTLDPTIIPTSNSSVNPYRAISRVETIATTTWQGVSAGGVTAHRRSQAAQVQDDSPTLSQPTVTPSRVDVFIPYSIEIGQDWGSLQAEMARLISDAKDDEEATSFTTGNGVAPNPLGILSGATTVVTGAGTAAYSVADLYAVYNALPPRFKPRAQWVANEAIYNLTRQFDTAGGASLWIDNLQLPTGGLGVPTPGNLNARLLGRGANECSAYAAGLTSGNLIITIGDFNYFVIVDRIGMDIELIPHLFGTSQMPTGQRGLFAFWRNGSTVVAANAFRTLITK